MIPCYSLEISAGGTGSQRQIRLFGTDLYLCGWYCPGSRIISAVTAVAITNAILPHQTGEGLFSLPWQGDGPVSCLGCDSTSWLNEYSDCLLTP